MPAIELGAFDCKEPSEETGDDAALRDTINLAPPPLVTRLVEGTAVGTAFKAGVEGLGGIVLPEAKPAGFEGDAAPERGLAAAGTGLGLAYAG